MTLTPKWRSKKHFLELFFSWIGAATGIGLCAWLSSHFFEPREQTLLIGSFGASAVLIYGAVHSPLAQPRNVLGGHVISAFVGVAVWKLMGDSGLASAMAVSFAILAMLITETVHPPGGATALIAVTGSAQLHNLGFLYPIIPVATGVIILLAVAILVNKFSPHREYPKYWLRPQED